MDEADLNAATVNVFFVYRRSSVRFGSTQMRCFQLCEILKRHGSGRFAFDTMMIRNLSVEPARQLWARTRPYGAIYIFVKDAIERLSAAALERLHVRAAAIVHDPIDRKLSLTPRRHVDLHIAASFAQQEALVRQFAATGDAQARVGLLLHQPDLRLHDFGEALPRDRLRPAYFGDPANAFLPPRLAPRIPVVDVGMTRSMGDHIARFATANLHYAVRPQEQVTSNDVIKPLTKAVTAARCGVPVMVNRTAPDAEALLGADYPYLIDEIEEDAVLSALDRAVRDFAGPTWQSALDRMHALALRVSPAQTARDLEDLLESLL
jgi:hypothetical protein